jgi:hypothetical protein
MKLGNAVEVAEFNPGEKMPPLIRGKLAERPFRAVGIANQDRLAMARYLDARPGVAGTRNAPGQILCLRTIYIHKNPSTSLSTELFEASMVTGRRRFHGF